MPDSRLPKSVMAFSKVLGLGHPLPTMSVYDCEHAYIVRMTGPAYVFALGSTYVERRRPHAMAALWGLLQHRCGKRG